MENKWKLNKQDKGKLLIALLVVIIFAGCIMYIYMRTEFRAREERMEQAVAQYEDGLAIAMHIANEASADLSVPVSGDFLHLQLIENAAGLYASLTVSKLYEEATSISMLLELLKLDYPFVIENGRKLEDLLNALSASGHVSDYRVLQDYLDETTMLDFLKDGGNAYAQ
ncbi:hypothetical protein LJC27_02620 [Christensenellaceae bacterium OttesenSCG-928-M15]|nr:hypothetical protein [Christensenellaceae bacterium OttesenSCG-928-M15]